MPLAILVGVLITFFVIGVNATGNTVKKPFKASTYKSNTNARPRWRTSEKPAKEHITPTFLESKLKLLVMTLRNAGYYDTASPTTPEDKVLVIDETIANMLADIFAKHPDLHWHLAAFGLGILSYPPTMLPWDCTISGRVCQSIPGWLAREEEVHVLTTPGYEIVLNVKGESK